MPRAASKNDAPAASLRRLTQQQAAELIGKPAVWLRDNANVAGGCRNADGTYDGPALVEVVFAKDSLASLNASELKRREAEARIRKEEAQADQCELETRKKMGDMVSRSDVETTMSAILSTYTEHFMGFADKLAPQLPVEVRSDVAELIRADTARTLLGISEELQRKVIPGDAGES
jgi:hypothetical protein